MFRLTINTDNAAFRDEDGNESVEAEALEIARMLEAVAANLKSEWEAPTRLFDFNGEKVGGIEFD